MPYELRAGEIRLDGRVRDVDVTRHSFVIEVSSFTTSRGRSRMMLPPKLKTVLVTPNTRFSQGANSKERATVSALKPGMSVAVIGGDRGEGQSLPAHFIILNAVAVERMKTVAARKSPDIRVSGFRVRINGRSHSGTLVQAHLDTVRIKVGLGRNQVGRTEPLASMARRHGALVGINGSSF